MACISCRVSICTQMSCLTEHANTGKGNAWSKTFKPIPSENQGGQSNPNKDDHFRKGGEEEDGEEEEQ